MDSFALSERWNGWTDLGVMVQARSAAIEAGPFDPLVCEVTLEWDDATTTLNSLDELRGAAGAAAPSRSSSRSGWRTSSKPRPA